MAPAITTEHLNIVNAILAAYLPAGAEVWVYGSRAKGSRVWRGSDLDLMVRAPERLSPELCEVLAEEFSESLLPYMVDLHDWHRADADFLAHIQPDMLPLSIVTGTDSIDANHVKAGQAVPT